MVKSELTQEKFKEIIDKAVNESEFQNLIEVIIHAKTCKECSEFYLASVEKAREHLKSESV